jgi:hypothetical protein
MTGIVGARYAPRHRTTLYEPLYGHEAVNFSPELDDLYVFGCQVAGGFPRAVELGERTFWVTPEGRQWAPRP